MVFFILGRDYAKPAGSIKRKKSITSPRRDLNDSNKREPISPPCVSPVDNCLTNKAANAKATVATSKIELNPESQRPDQQRATSTTSHDNETDAMAPHTNTKVDSTPADPAEWSVDDVMRYLTSVDAGLSVHAQLFQKHVMQFDLVFLVHFVAQVSQIYSLGN